MLCGVSPLPASSGNTQRHHFAREFAEGITAAAYNSFDVAFARVPRSAHVEFIREVIPPTCSTGRSDGRAPVDRRWRRHGAEGR